MTDMEGIERRSESPSTRASSRLSNFTNQDLLVDQELTTRKKSPSAKRKSRNSDKENGEVDVAKNGEINGSEDHQHHNGGDTEMVEINVANNIEQNGNESNLVSDDGAVENEKNCMENDANGNIQEKTSTNGDPRSEEEEVETVETSSVAQLPNQSEEVSQRESENESVNVGLEESYCTAEYSQIDRTESSELNTTNDNEILESDNEREKENGIDGEKIIAKNITLEEQKAVEKKGFFWNWNFNRSSEKKEIYDDENDFNTNNLYYSTVRGRVPLNRASPNVSMTDKDSVIFRGGLKTPTTTRKLNDSFGVKSEPSRMTRGESLEKPTLRKFAAKRCLNAEEADEKEDSFMSNLTFAKRRKLNDDKNRTGFLRSFLWSPFRKKSEDDDILNEPEDRGTVAKVSWFKSPFWFWKKCRNTDERN